MLVEGQMGLVWDSIQTFDKIEKPNHYKTHDIFTLFTSSAWCEITSSGFCYVSHLLHSLHM